MARFGRKLPVRFTVRETQKPTLLHWPLSVQEPTLNVETTPGANAKRAAGSAPWRIGSIASPTDVAGFDPLSCRRQSSNCPPAD